MVDLNFDRGDNEDVEYSLASLERNRRFYTPPDSNHPPHTSTGRPTNQNASATASALPPIDAEELGVLIWPTQPASFLFPKPFNDVVADVLTEERVPVLRQFFSFDIGERSGGFAGTPADLACQGWDLKKAYNSRRKYASRMEKAAWDDVVHLPVRHDDYDPSRGPSDP